MEAALYCSRMTWIPSRFYFSTPPPRLIKEMHARRESFETPVFEAIFVSAVTSWYQVFTSSIQECIKFMVDNQPVVLRAKASDYYSGVVLFKSHPEHRLIWVFCAFLRLICRLSRHYCVDVRQYSFLTSRFKFSKRDHPLTVLMIDKITTIPLTLSLNSLSSADGYTFNFIHSGCDMVR
jgi:hypothetical protein